MAWGRGTQARKKPFLNTGQSSKIISGFKSASYSIGAGNHLKSCTSASFPSVDVSQKSKFLAPDSDLLTSILIDSGSLSVSYLSLIHASLVAFVSVILLCGLVYQFSRLVSSILPASWGRLWLRCTTPKKLTTPNNNSFQPEHSYNDTESLNLKIRMVRSSRFMSFLRGGSVSSVRSTTVESSYSSFIPVQMDNERLYFFWIAS